MEQFSGHIHGRLKRTDLDRTSLVHSLADGIETAVRKSRPEGRQEFDIHLALDEDALIDYASMLWEDW